MRKAGDFVEHVLDLLGPLGQVSARAMFGGYGLYRDGTIFGIVADETLYLKVDDRNRANFVAEDMGPFRPWDDKPMVLRSYYEVPAALLEDGDSLSRWAHEAFCAALRAAATKTRKKK